MKPEIVRKALAHSNCDGFAELQVGQYITALEAAVLIARKASTGHGTDCTCAVCEIERRLSPVIYPKD